MSDDPFVLLARYRRAFADLVAGLTEEQLARPSLCARWDVRTVAGHLAAASSPSTGEFLRALVRHRGNPHRANDALAARAAARPTAELLALLRDRAGVRSAPPVVGVSGPLTDVLVHTADVAVPLGIPVAPLPDDVRPSLEFVTAGRPAGFVPRGRLAGLRLVCDDAGFAHGDGARIAGRGIDVLVAACGRPAVLDRLTGPGVDVLRDRLG